MKNKFLFINLSLDTGSGWIGPNHGIAFLVPVVKKHGYEVKCLNISNLISDEQFSQEVNSFNPDIVAFSLTSHQLKYLIKYSKLINKDILSIAGGVGPTLDPINILAKTDIKGVCIGEGEIPLDRLLTKIDNNEDVSKSDSFFWKTKDGIIKNAVKQFPANLDDLAFPDYSVFENSIVNNNFHLNIILSRGCPFSCYYCGNDALRSVYPVKGGYFRLPTVEYSINLLKDLLNKYPNTKYLGFEDDLLIANKEWFLEFAKRYKNEINLPYRVGVRVEFVNPEIVEALAYSGCDVASIGVESGSEELRKELLNRKHSDKELIEKSKMLKDAGIKLTTFNMVGFPNETTFQMKQTFELNKRIVPDGGVCTFFYPYTGTHLYEHCKNTGLLLEDNEAINITNYWSRPSIKMDANTSKTTIKYKNRIQNLLSWMAFKRKMKCLKPSLRSYLKILFYWALFIFEIRPALGNFVKRLTRGAKPILYRLLKLT